MRNIILCSADSVYSKEYVHSLCKSAELAGFDICMNYMLTSNMDKEVLDLNYNIGEWSDTTKIKYESSFVLIPDNLSKDQMKVYYSCGRINALIQFMEYDVFKGEVNAYMALDIDSIINRSFKFPVNNNVGLSFYYRDPKEHGAVSSWEYRGMKLLGTFFVTTKMLPYLKKVKKCIEDNNYSNWFIDQVALYESMSPQDLADSYDYSKDNIIGWDVDNLLNTPVVTGKGQRKFNKNYLELQNKYKDMMLKDMENVESCDI